MKARFSTFRIRVGFQYYAVLCRILPAKASPHVGADSPRYLEPLQGGTIQLIRVLKDAKDVTERIDADLRKALIERACLMAGVRRESNAPRPTGQLSLSIAGGHLSRALEQTK